jgi:YD repeat-containing protein
MCKYQNFKVRALILGWRNVDVPPSGSNQWIMFKATPTDTTNYAYNGRTTTITTLESTHATTLNASGQTQSETVNGKTVNHTYYASGLPHTSTPQDGSSVTMEYDLQGKRIKLTDPDAGIVTTKYNGFGELLWKKQKVHSTNDTVVTPPAVL